MKKHILFILFFASVSFLYSQTDFPFENDNTPVETHDTVVNNEIYTVVEAIPEFPGGSEKMMLFISKNLKIPETDEVISGTVYVTFVIERDGSISNVKILRGIREDYNNEVIRVVKSMPKWIPGKQNGKAVRVQYNLPIKFHP